MPDTGCVDELFRVQENGRSCCVVRSIYAVPRPHYGLFQTRIEATRRLE